MEYKLITGVYGKFLNNLNHLLSNGWELYGNPFFVSAQTEIVEYAQAIIKNFTDPFIVITGSMGMLSAQIEEYQKHGYEKLGLPQETGEKIEIVGDLVNEYAVILKKVGRANTTNSV